MTIPSRRLDPRGRDLQRLRCFGSSSTACARAASRSAARPAATRRPLAVAEELGGRGAARGVSRTASSTTSSTSRRSRTPIRGWSRADSYTRAYERLGGLGRFVSVPQATRRRADPGGQAGTRGTWPSRMRPRGCRRPGEPHQPEDASRPASRDANVPARITPAAAMVGPAC